MFFGYTYLGEWFLWVIFEFFAGTHTLVNDFCVIFEVLRVHIPGEWFCESYLSFFGYTYLGEWFLCHIWVFAGTHTLVNDFCESYLSFFRVHIPWWMISVSHIWGFSGIHTFFEWFLQVLFEVFQLNVPWWMISVSHTSGFLGNIPWWMISVSRISGFSGTLTLVNDFCESYFRFFGYTYLGEWFLWVVFQVFRVHLPWWMISVSRIWGFSGRRTGGWRMTHTDYCSHPHSAQTPPPRRMTLLWRVRERLHCHQRAGNHVYKHILSNEFYKEG